MLPGTVFYNQSTKNILVAFARLFSDIKIARQNATGAVEQVIAVPIAYANKEKALQRVESDPKLANHTRVSLPRLSFEIHGYKYDSSRKLNRANQLICNSADGTGRKQISTPAPYDISISLYAVTKTAEDGLQILEQICPFFVPERTVNINVIPSMNITHDIPIVLHGVDVEDNAQGSYEDSRIVIHTFSFTVKAYLYGPVYEGKTINHVTANLPTLGVYHADGTTPVDPITDTWTEF